MSNAQKPGGEARGSHRTRRLPMKWAGVLAAALAVLAIGAVGLLFIPVNMPLPRAAALANDQLEFAMRERARLPAGHALTIYARGITRARLMVETPSGALIVSTRGSDVYWLDPDKDEDGRADAVRLLLSGLNQPHGVLLDGGFLYVAEEHRVSRYSFNATSGAITGAAQMVLEGLPDDGGHSTRTLKKGPDGWLYLAIGSSCNACIETHPWRAALLRFHPGEKPQIFATGLRNTVGFDWQPGSDVLYGVDNGRDLLGDDFPPDELNRIDEGQFYGWPYRNGMNVPDPQWGHDFAGAAVPPVFAFDAHVAPLSIRFLRHQSDAALNGVALVAEHGSWNRSRKQGYRIEALSFAEDGRITRQMFLTGFLRNESVLGRPVDILERGDGSLLISDDYNGVIWRVSREK